MQFSNDVFVSIVLVLHDDGGSSSDDGGSSRHSRSNTRTDGSAGVDIRHLIPLP